VDSQGLIHAVALTTANVTDRAGAIQAMTEYQENLSWVQSVLVMEATRVNPLPRQ
jgi:hypothetical protein